MRTLVSSVVSSTRTMSTVSLRFLPFTRTVSPRKSESLSMVRELSEMTELSSPVASSTTRRLGEAFRRRMAVAVSLGRARTRRGPPHVSARMRPGWGSYALVGRRGAVGLSHGLLTRGLQLTDQHQ